MPLYRGWALYQRLLETHPLAVQMTTTSILYCIGDTLSQHFQFASARYRARRELLNRGETPESLAVERPSLAPEADRDIVANIENVATHKTETRVIHRAVPTPEDDAETKKRKELLMLATKPYWDSFKFDYERNSHMTTFGFLATGPILHYWYTWLDGKFPQKTMKTIGKKILLDQSICAPLFNLFFFSTMSIVFERKSIEEAKEKLRKEYIKTMIADCAVWPLAQLINFRFIPAPQRVLFVNLVNIGWCCFLATAQHSHGGDDDEPPSLAKSQQQQHYNGSRVPVIVTPTTTRRIEELD